MIRYVTGDESILLSYQTLCAKALACPRIATRIGGGIHVSDAELIAEAFDKVAKHSALELWRHRALSPDDLRATGTLLAAEQVDLQAAWDGAASLDPSWGGRL